MNDNMYLEIVMDAKRIQQLKNKVSQRLAGCKARLSAGTIIRENEAMIEFNDVDGDRHCYAIASADAMEKFIANDHIDFNKLSCLEIVQLVKALMEFGSTDIENNDSLISVLMYLLGSTIGS